MGGYFYTTKQGDMWDYIAYLVYGDEYMMNVLLRANPEYGDVYLFEAGAKIWCPEIDSESDEEAIADWRDEEDIEDEEVDEIDEEEDVDEEE